MVGPLATSIGGVPTIATSAVGALRWAVGASKRPTSSCVMAGSSAPVRGGRRRTVITCEHCAVPSITVPWIRCLYGTNSGYEKRQNDRMLPSCHLSCPHASLSDATHRPLRPTRAHAGRAHKRHRGWEEHAAAPHRDEGPRWQQAREPCQTLCQMGPPAASSGKFTVSAACHPPVTVNFWLMAGLLQRRNRRTEVLLIPKRAL
jgi:hypothetical protein